MTIKLRINTRTVDADAHDSILNAARQNGIVIPTLCHHQNLSPEGSCRLCIVEVEGYPHSAAACCTEATPGMEVRTETEALASERRQILHMLLQRYHDSETGGDRIPTEFERWLQHYGVDRTRYQSAKPRYPVDSDPNPLIRVDLNKCILCGRCVRACAEIQGRFVWEIAGRGTDPRLIAGPDTTMIDGRCECCGACVHYCPTAALSDRSQIQAGQPDTKVATTCPYCGVGCSFDLNVKDHRIVGVTSRDDAPVNGSHLCVKGRYGFDFVHHPERLKTPKVRRYLLENRPRTKGRDEWIDVDWDTALHLAAEKLLAIKRQSGPDAVGVLSSAKCTNEENYLMQKFARQVIGTHNIDHCARLCHSSTVAGLAMCYGSGAMSNTMADIADAAEAVFVIGSNTTEQHPVFGNRLRQAVLRRGLKLVVADPRAIDLTEFAALHLRQHPGTDVALLNGLMHIIVQNAWHDTRFISQRTENFEAFRAVVEGYPPPRVAAITGIAESLLYQAAEILALNKPMAVVWSMGITQHTTGIQNVLSLGNLQMLLGNMGVAGGGVNPLRGQNNVQGACDMGALPNVLPAYQAVTSADVREKFNQAWALTGRPHLFGDKPGLTLTEMIGAAGGGKVRGLYILGENPVMTDPDSNHVRDCLERTEFIVLQEIFPSETSVYADVLLPGASWAEKHGTFTNTERRIQLVRKAIEPVGEARVDWSITAQLATRILALENHQPGGAYAGWNYRNSTDIMAEIAALTPSYGGVNHARLEAGAALHWPVPTLEHDGTPILHIGQFTRGRGIFHACEHLPAQELPSSEYPFCLTTGRVLYHWHGGEMTRRVESLLAVCPESLVEINEQDAAAIGVTGNQKVILTSRRGEMTARAIVTDRVAPGVVFGNFHFPGEHNVNNLTIAALDPIAKIPEYKVCAVKIDTV
jgi:formate dehydrogenase alpha subunit